MLRNRLAPLALILLLVCGASVARADKVDDYIRGELEKLKVPGVSVAIVKDGKIIKAQGYGLANVELNVPVKPETVFKIGSVSKQFLAAGIMLLVQDGKLGVDDKISKYLEGTPETWRDITIRHLLTHTSGIVREAPGFQPFKPQNDSEVVATAYVLPLRFTPGEKWEYCNVGYFALAEIIHKVSGKPWGDFLTERVFGPLEMTATGPTTYKEIISNRANGYDMQQGKLKNAEEYLAVRPSGGFQSTILDMVKWDAALNTDKILKQSTRDQMWTPVKLTSGKNHPYGFGWDVGATWSHKLIGHGGSLSGFTSEFDRYVDDKLSIIVLTNASFANPAGMAQEIAILNIPDLIPKPKFDVTGDWDFQTEVADQKGAPQFSFKLEGNKLSGKYKGQYGEADLSGSVEGDKIEFRFRSSGTAATYIGTIADKDHMQGQANYGEIGVWTGQRR